MDLRNISAMPLPAGNLTEMANDTLGSTLLAIISIVWTLWIVVSMLVSWQNSESSGNYDPAVSYIWTLPSENAVIRSWLPAGYFWSWIFNFFVFTVEGFAVAIGGEFLLLWAQVGLWGGLIVCAFPWIMELIYITQEYPERQSGQVWPYIFWSAEFWMFFMQCLLWFISFWVHVIALPSIATSYIARRALESGATNECKCYTCKLPQAPEERLEAEAICKAACNAKCPPEQPPCPLTQFEDENLEDYAMRCAAAAELAKDVTDEETKTVAEDNELDDEDDEDDGDESLPIDDISSPDDEW